MLLAVPMLLAIAGCTQYWQHWARPGGTDVDFAAANASCETSSAKRFPPMTTQGPGYFVGSSMECEPTAAGTNCLGINPGYLPQITASGDLNERPRETTFQACMAAGGWRPVGTPAEGAAITRSGSTQISEAAVGQAVTYCEFLFNRQRNTPAYHGKLDQCVIARARELNGS
jgi:hypothetical protein